MARLMCFRPTKKLKQSGDVYSLSKDANVAPNGRMISRDVSADGLSVQYITARIIVLACDEPDNQKYVESLKTAAATLKNKHFDHYKVWNVSRRRGDVQRILEAEESGWPRGLAPPLDRLCAICKQLEQWLSLHPQNVVVLHCKGDRSRAAMVLAAHMHYNVICANDDPVEDRFSIKRFADQYIGGGGQPSHRRYIHYFSSLLSGKVVVNSNSLYLMRLAVSHLNGNTLAFKIYERMQPVYESTAAHAKDVLRWDVDGELKLRGDVLVKVFQISGEKKRELLRCQLNTCSLELKSRTTALTFHKEELDLVFNDPSIHNDVLLELLVSVEPPKSSSKKQIGHLEHKTNSYEDFQQAEDEFPANGQAVIYSEIKKEGKKSKEPTTMPPPVPPKPRSHSAMAEPIAESQPERRGVLPAQVRPVVHRPPSPRTAAERATPSLEPDLVGKDRYDKASKCFSYAPKKELNEAFERPRKPSFSRNIEPKAEEQFNHVDPSEAAAVPIQTGQALKPIEPKMTWDGEVEKAKQDALLDQLSRMPIRSHSVAGQPYYQRRDEEVEERPMILDQAQRAVTTTTPTGTLNRNHKGTNYGSYKTLHDDRFSSAMDDLCDPDFYLNYKAPVPPPRHAGAKSVEMPRRRFQPVESFTDPLDEILNTQAGSCRDVSAKGRDTFRERNCQSVAATPSRFPGRTYAEQRDCPFFRSRKLFAHQYEATEQARDADDWLSTQLRKVRSKRNLAPDLVRRRTQEQMLLEELKNVNDQRDAENYGGKPDPLAEFRREEERLRNTHSPYQDGSRRGRGVRSKPPTPPPRDRSRSPARSEVATPSIDSHTYKHMNGHAHNENSDFDFSTLNSIVQPASSGRTSRTLNRKPSFGSDRPPFQYQDMTNRPETPTRYFSGQERVAAAICRAETPQREMYASGTIYRPETPSRYFPENTTLTQRSATPQFPRETPIPFHPLLYSASNGASKQDMDRAQTMNYRSSSPRSQYGQLSRRSSLTSVASRPMATCEPGPSVVLHMKRSDEASLASSESSGCSSEASSPCSTRSPPSDPRQETGILQGSRDSSIRPRETSTDHHVSSASQASSPQGILKPNTSEIIHHHPVFVKDTSKYWYKPNISREAAINMLRDKQPGTFVVRDSNSFPGAFGLALKVAQPPPGVAPADGTELVRHFLIEPSPKGVKLKGCNNEPVFGSLSALVYQHSMTPLALPTKLLLPEYDPASTPEHVSATQALLEQGAACNVAFIGSVDVESLTGTECVRRAIAQGVEDVNRGMSRPVSVHFKVSSQGITLTDNTRKVFFRRHVGVNTVIYAGMDPSDRRFDNSVVLGFGEHCVDSARMFAFVARKPSSMENVCHIFAELEPEQPASAVINFINKVMLANRRN